ncbi:hypothetical protein STTU_4127 [Streptomyces sp. Tu6071]|nr:hypothetical protein STTU_4127 [Streptomyces sp. Tu6071]
MHGTGRGRFRGGGDGTWCGAAVRERPGAVRESPLRRAPRAAPYAGRRPQAARFPYDRRRLSRHDVFPRPH